MEHPSIINRERYQGQVIYAVRINSYVINVTVTSDPSVVSNWIATTLFLRNNILYNNNLVVGMGVQWSPYSPDPFPPANILTLCVGRRCLIFQLSYAMGAPLILHEFLMNPRHTFVGFWNLSDRRRLESSLHRLRMFAEPLDLRFIVKSNRGESLVGSSVNVIVRRTMGFRVNQSIVVRESTWDQRFLSDEQIVYCSVDAYCAFLIGRNRGAWNHNRYRYYS